MSAETQAIFKAALALDPVLREKLADALWASLEAPGQEMSEAEFLGELDRRSEEYKRDPSCALPWSEVKKRLLS